MPASLFDSSVWIALAFGSHPHHGVAKAAFESADNGAPVVFCRATQQSFLRQLSSLTLQSAYGAKLISNAAAWQKWEELLDLPQVSFAGEPDGLADLWSRFAVRDTASPKVWMDAYLAAFAISGGLDFVTLDGDFLAYERHGLRLRLLGTRG
ncbi:MAG: PIN domain-containing protein [Bryobacterales bacterium]|nr:PIN domain-containing protein [Opitutaceae bacterium]MCZ2155820.1 PIN domain-containing protein [Bryobacterales bacterium]